MKATRMEQLQSGKWLEFVYDDNNTHKQVWDLVEIKLPRKYFDLNEFEEIYARFCDAQASEPDDDVVEI